ncbi:MAG: diacylglycerol/lipid kinase family protein [Oscillospiraceae bacterium]
MTHIFIINPEAGESSLADDLRERLGRIEGLRFFIFVTRHKGYEFQLVQRIKHFFEGEQLRIYCCGGSGTMRNILSAYGDISDAEFAFYPCGTTNGFLSTTGVPVEQFRNIEALINGKAIETDYIRTNHGMALNTISVGLDADFAGELEKHELLGATSGVVAFLTSAFHTLFAKESHQFIITLDNYEIDRFTAEFLFANGHTLGGVLTVSDNCNICDGRASYLIGPRKRSFLAIPFLKALVSKNFDSIREQSECGNARRITMRRADGQPFAASFDGEVDTNITELEAEVVQRGLHFVMPAEQNGGALI